MADGSSARLDEEQALALFLDRLKLVERKNPLATDARRERVAEHSWHVAVCVMLLADAAPEPFDRSRAVQMALVHDMAEAYVGDTFAFGPGVDSQHEREHTAMDRLRQRSASPAVKELLGLWDEYEEQRTPAARFVKAIDAYLPIALNHANLEASSWKAHAVGAGQVQKRLDRVRDMLGALADVCDEWIAGAKASNYLR